MRRNMHNEKYGTAEGSVGMDRLTKKNEFPWIHESSFINIVYSEI